MGEWGPALGALTMLTLALFSAEWAFIAWLSRQFTRVYGKMDELTDRITAKLEYHEKHDDKRFADINNNLWELRVRNAARDAFDLKWLDKRPNLSNSQRKENSEETSQNPL